MRNHHRIDRRCWQVSPPAARRRRLFSAGQRLGLAIRDKGCVFPGCDRPPSWCEAHHIDSWAIGGATDLTNGCLLCGYHHRLVHKGDWQIIIAGDNHPNVIPPDWIDTARTHPQHLLAPPLATQTPALKKGSPLNRHTDCDKQTHHHELSAPASRGM